jgi:hypothetical protein
MLCHAQPNLPLPPDHRPARPVAPSSQAASAPSHYDAGPSGEPLPVDGCCVSVPFGPRSLSIVTLSADWCVGGVAVASGALSSLIMQGQQQANQSLFSLQTAINDVNLKVTSLRAPLRRHAQLLPPWNG